MWSSEKCFVITFIAFFWLCESCRFEIFGNRTNWVYTLLMYPLRCIYKSSWKWEYYIYNNILFVHLTRYYVIIPVIIYALKWLHLFCFSFKNLSWIFSQAIIYSFKNALCGYTIYYSATFTCEYVIFYLSIWKHLGI